jgi:hypothetical protein
LWSQPSAPKYVSRVLAGVACAVVDVNEHDALLYHINPNTMVCLATTGTSQRGDVWQGPGHASTAFNGRLPSIGVPAYFQVAVERTLMPGVASSQPAHTGQLQQEEEQQQQRGGQAPLLRLMTRGAREVLEHVYKYAPAEVGPACHLCLRRMADRPGSCQPCLPPLASGHTYDCNLLPACDTPTLSALSRTPQEPRHRAAQEPLGLQQVLPADVLQLLLQGEEQLQDVEQLLQGSPEVVGSRLGDCHGRFQLRLAPGGGAEESREARWVRCCPAWQAA